MTFRHLRAYLFAVIYLVLMCTGQADAADVDRNSANYVLPGCQNFALANYSDMFLQGSCVGKVSGIAFASKTVCAPAEATNLQLIHVVIAYIEARPARMPEGFNKLADEAMTAAWPCPR